MKTLNYLIIILACTLISNSCTKDVAGPTGPQGQTGPQGPSSSYYVTIDSVAAGSTLWSESTNIAGTTIYTLQVYPTKGLTSPINSIVEVYYSTTYNTQSTWYELPIGNALSSGDAFDFYYKTYNTYIEYINSTPPANPWIYFKVVVITNP
jgi:hypothetical protein